MGAPTPAQKQEAQEILDSGELNAEDAYGLVEDFANQGVELTYNPGPVYDSPGADPEVSNPERFPELDSVRSALPGRKRGVAMPEREVSKLLEDTGGSMSSWIKQYETSIGSADPKLIGRSHTGIPTLTKPPYYKGRDSTQASVLTRPYVHNEPTVQNIADMLAREVSDEQNPEHIRQVAHDRLVDLEKNGRDSDAYKEAADNQWVEVYKAFEAAGYPVHRPAFSKFDDADGDFGATEGMLVDKTLSSPLFSWAGGLDTGLTFGAGKQAAANVGSRAQEGGMDLLNKTGELTGLWNSPTYDQSEKIVQRLREQGVLPKSAGEELGQVEEMHPGSSLLGNFSSLLYGGGAAGQVGNAAVAGTKALKKALPWMFRGSPAVQKAIQALTTGALGGLGFGAGEEAVEAGGEAFRGDDTNFAGETLDRAPRDALTGAAVNGVLHGLGEFGTGMQEGLRSAPETGVRVQKFENGGGRLGFTGMKKSPEMKALERDALKGEPVAEVGRIDEFRNMPDQERLVLNGEELALERAGETTHKALNAQKELILGKDDVTGLAGSMENKFYGTTQGKRVHPVTELGDTMFDVVEERIGAPLADSTIVQKLFPTVYKFVPAFTETMTDDLARFPGSRALTYQEAIKILPALRRDLEAIKRSEVLKMAGPDATPEDLEGAQGLIDEDLHIIFAPQKVTAKKLQEGVRAIDNQIRWDKERGREEPALRRMAAAIRQTREKWGQDWVDTNDIISRMFERIARSKNAAGIVGQDVDLGNRIQRSNVSKTVAAYQQGGRIPEDKALVQLLAWDKPTRDLLKQYAGLKAGNELSRGDASASLPGVAGMMSRNLGVHSPARRLADPWFGTMGQLGSRPAAAALSSKAPLAELGRELFGVTHKLTTTDYDFLGRLVDVYSKRFFQNAPRPREGDTATGEEELEQ